MGRTAGSKNKDKDQHASDRSSSVTHEMDGVTYSKRMRLDASYYIDKYPDMQFMWINDMDGDVQYWLQLGAEPQEEESDKFNKKFPGLTDKNSGGYVTVLGGTDNGVPFQVYLLKMSKEEYHRVKISPNNQKNHDIQVAMGLAAQKGEVDTKARDGSGLETYAPNLPSGGKGFEQSGFNSLT